MKRRLTLVAALAALVAAGVATYSWAAASDGQTINACVGSDGKLGIATATGECKKGETPLSWNTAGPAGAQGERGPQGLQGPVGPSASDPDSVSATLQVTGARQGAFSTSPMALVGISHEIVSPRDPSTGQASGKRTHKPFVITKRFDKSTPLFLQALVTNENLTSVLIGLLKSDGTQEATITLHNAQISDYVQHGATVQYSFVYQSIEWADGGVSVQDDLQTGA